MAKPEWGSKRVCQNCGAKFYDFHRSPILCPSCGSAYQPDEVLKPRRSRVEPKGRAAAKPVPVEEAEEEVEEEADPLLDDAEEEEDEVEEALVADEDEDEDEADEEVKAVKPARDPLIPDDESEDDEALDEEVDEDDVDDVEEEFEDDEPER